MFIETNRAKTLAPSERHIFIDGDYIMDDYIIHGNG